MLFALAGVGCGPWVDTPTRSVVTPPVTAAATPVFTPVGGSYASAQQVTLSDATPGAVIYYTTNGTTPTPSSTVYSSPIAVTSSETLEAIAVASGYTNSAVASAVYSISVTLPAAATPVFSPVAGSYSSAQTVTISDITSGASIYYTTNGMTPTAASSLYTGGILVSSTETIEAIAVASGYTNSAVATATYTISSAIPVTAGEWTWMSGSSMAYPSAVYGTQGVAAAGNTPGPRQEASTWTDSSGNLWLFGGAGQSASIANIDFNDLWKFNPSTSEWTWVGGSNTPGAPGSYAAQGVASPSNFPGARFAASHWTDSSGNFWLFGGAGTSFSVGDFNDLWEFIPALGEWVWVNGGDGQAIGAVYGTQGVAAASNSPGTRGFSMTWVDSTGSFWLFGGGGIDVNGTTGWLNDLWKFNPSTRMWTWVSGSNLVAQPGNYGTLGTPSATNVPGGRMRGFGWADSQGNIWIFAGMGYDSAGTFSELNDLWELNPTTKVWAWIGGSSLINRASTYGTVDVPSSSNVMGSRYGFAGWIDSSGNLWVFGGVGYNPFEPYDDPMSDLWEFNPSTKEWTWVTGSDLVLQDGVYGMLGVPAAGNSPGARFAPSSWTDSNGSFWLFGGNGCSNLPCAGQTVSGMMNDFWQYQP